MIGAEVRQSERIEMLLDDVCHYCGGMFSAPPLKEFAEMLKRRGLEIRDAEKPVERLP